MLARIRRIRQLRAGLGRALDVAAAVDGVVDIPGDWNELRAYAKSLGVTTHHRTRKQIERDVKRAQRKQ